MCLGELGVVRAVDVDGTLVVETASRRRLIVSALTLDQRAAVGDWVLTHSGFALGVVAEEEAQQALTARAAIDGRMR